MITGSAVSSAKNTRQCVGDLGQNVQKKLSSWMSSVAALLSGERGREYLGLESRSQSQRPIRWLLCCCHVKKSRRLPSISRTIQSLYRQRDHSPPLVKQTETFQVKDSSDGVTNLKTFLRHILGPISISSPPAMEAISQSIHMILPSQQTNPQNGAG